jgi:S1-C subfamily serine protease
LAVGNPFGLGGSVTRGILSSKSRQVPKEGEPLDIPNWLQTDAPINRGNSGGPLVNLRGELIGINVAVLNEDPSGSGQNPQGIGFAIPIRLVEEALSDIFPTEFVRSYWFGARVKVGSYPLMITAVQPESPAGRADLRTGDIVLRVNGRAPRSFIEFGDLLATNAGSAIPISIRRGEGVSEVTVRLVPKETVFNAGMVRDRVGLSLERTPNGFAISAVQPASPAEAAGLRRGMLIRAVDGQPPPADVTALAQLLYARKKGESVRLDMAMMERVGNFNVLHQGVAELMLR